MEKFFKFSYPTISFIFESFRPKEVSRSLWESTKVRGGDGA